MVWVLLVWVFFNAFSFAGGDSDLFKLHYENPVETEKVLWETETEFWKMIYVDSVQPKESLLSQAFTIFKLDGSQYEGPLKALYYIHYILNYLLWFVSFIALVLLIYIFYVYMVGADEKAMGKVKWMLKTVFIVIMVLGLSWLIVSFMFNIYQKQLAADPLLSALFLNSLS